MPLIRCSASRKTLRGYDYKGSDDIASPATAPVPCFHSDRNVIGDEGIRLFEKGFIAEQHKRGVARDALRHYARHGSLRNIRYNARIKW